MRDYFRETKIPTSFPLLDKLAQLEPDFSHHIFYMTALMVIFKRRGKLRRFGASILYRTLGKHFSGNAASAVPLLPLAMQFAKSYPVQVRRAGKLSGFAGNSLTLGVNLFRAILNKRSGLIISRHSYKEGWSLIKNQDGRIHLEIAEMLEELAALGTEQLPVGPQINRLTASARCDPLSKTPYHKYVPVQIEKVVN